MVQKEEEPKEREITLKRIISIIIDGNKKQQAQHLPTSEEEEIRRHISIALYCILFVFVFVSCIEIEERVRMD